MTGRHTSVFIEIVRELAYEPDELRNFLSTKDLPLFQLYIDFGEAMAFFESNDEEFSEAEAGIIRSLDEFVSTLPPEPDPHWADESIDSPLWEETRARFQRAIAALEDLNRP